MKNTIPWQVALLIIVALAGENAHAYDQDFVRIACVSEANYLKVEHVRIESESVYGETNFDDKASARRLKTWERNGFYFPKDFTVKCAMNSASYQITSKLIPFIGHGPCGDESYLQLTLKRGSETVLDEVYFGLNDCLQTPSIASLEISEAKPGWGSGFSNLCAHGEAGQPDTCKDFSSGTALVQQSPIDQEKFASLFSSGAGH